MSERTHCPADLWAMRYETAFDREQERLEEAAYYTGRDAQRLEAARETGEDQILRVRDLVYVMVRPDGSTYEKKRD